MKKLLTLPKTLFLAIVSRPHLLVAIGLLLLCALIWFFGPLVGMGSESIRIILIGGILLTWALFLFYDRYRASQGARLLEESLQQQGQDHASRAGSEKKEEHEAVRLQFEKALATLKQSKLGKGYKGRAALYALPWYLFIGPSASGKSTALRESGLQFPYLGENKKGVQGIGGTRNCDWWFTSEAVLLDTAGRYMTEEDDREEWSSFLDLLKKARRQKPINGVIVAVSIAEIIQASDQDIEWHAGAIRERIDELMTRLGLNFPVYLVFTKCDLIEGFVQFFGDFSVARREQIWGCTLKRRTAVTPLPQDQFDEEFRQLLATLQAWRVERMTAARGSEKVKILGFPLQMASCQQALSRFVELLFHQNPYQENPYFRGFYFTSGTQEGNPIDRIIQTVSQAAGLQERVAEPEHAGEPKSYFIKNLFTDVIFPDRVLASLSSSVYRQRGYVRVAVFGAAVLGVGLSLFGMASSYLGNKYLVRSVQGDAVTIAGLHGGNTQSPGTQGFASHIEQLDQIRNRLDTFRQYEEDGIPIRLWGFYQGDRLSKPLTRLYQREFEKIVMEPMKDMMESRLARVAHQSSISQPELESDSEGYSLFKAYLMLADGAHLHPEFLSHQLQRVWNDGLVLALSKEENDPQFFVMALERVLTFYSHHLAGEMASDVNLDDSLVKDVRRVLRRVPIEARLYGQTLHKTSQKLVPFSLETALGGRGAQSLKSHDTIPGIYTKEGWETVFHPALPEVLEELGQEYWVLGEKQPNPDDLTSSVEVRYFGDYSKQWTQFLESVHIRQPSSPQDTLALLEELTAKPSPLSLLLKAVKNHTGLERNMLVSVDERDGGFIQKIKKKLLFEETGPEGNLVRLAFDDPVYRDFRSLHHFTNTPQNQEEGNAPLDDYLEKLRESQAILQKVLPEDGELEGPVTLAQSIAEGKANEISKAADTVEQLSLKLSPEVRRIVQPLLLEPLVIAAQSVMNRSLGALNTHWELEIYQPCRETIAGRYPFQQSGEDAALSDVSQFFHPQSGILWAFFDQQIKPFIRKGEEGWESKPWRGAKLPISSVALENLQYARLLSESLFPVGEAGPRVAFDLMAYPDQGASAPLVSQTRLKLGEQEVLYQMGPQEWQELIWPGPSGSGGAFLQVKLNGTWEPWESQGWWGLFRLLENGRVRFINESLYQVEWVLQSRDAHPLRIRYDLKAKSSQNPFKPGFFKKFTCVSSLGEV